MKKTCFCMLASMLAISGNFAEEVSPIAGGLEKSYPIVGNLKPLHQTKIGTQVSGRVKAIFVDMGDRVKKGQVLASLDPVFLQIELKKLTALHEMAQASFEEADMELHRLQPLWEKNPPSISKKSFDDALIRHKQRKAQVDQSLADLENTKQRLLEMDIVAPYSGVIVKRYVDCGESVTTMPAVTVAEIIDDSELLLEFSLPQELMGKVQVHTDIQLEISGVHEEKLAKITLVAPHVDESTRTFRCQSSIDNKEGKWRSGLFVKGMVFYKDKENALHAPKEAFVQEEGKWMARVKENNQVILRPVEVSFCNEKEIEVTSGLKPTDILIIEK